MSKSPSIQEKPIPTISMRGITKSFPGIMANDHINLDIYSSEIHTLLGENGAGKSTLVKILYGYYRADSGEILLNGHPVTIHSPYDARGIHIGMVFQEFNLIPAFSVAENIALFLPDLKSVINLKVINRKIIELSERYNLQVDPQAMVSQLSIGEQQKVEILKLLLSDARLLILDEPTRVLAPHEVQALLNVLYSLRKDGYAIFFITHKMKEVLECADRITVLRAGRLAGTLSRAEATEEKLVSMMFEKDVSKLKIRTRPTLDKARPPVLELQEVGSRGEGAETSLKGIDLKIFPGEIVGIAGVSGNGQKELGDLVLGITKCIHGSKLLFGHDCTQCSTQMIRRSGVGFIPENPHLMASVPFMSTLENMVLTNTWRYARLGGVSMDWQAVKMDYEAMMKKLGYTFSLYAPAKSLSGGNLQRMVIVREMAHDPQLIVASYLTRGLDVQSTIAARQALIQAREAGAGVLLISEDLEELFTLSDRLIVLYAGKIAGTFKPDETNINQVGHLMTGSEAKHVPDN